MSADSTWDEACAAASWSARGKPQARHRFRRSERAQELSSRCPNSIRSHPLRQSGVAPEPCRRVKTLSRHGIPEANCKNPILTRVVVSDLAGTLLPGTESTTSQSIKQAHPMNTLLTREELIDLVDDIMKARGTEKELEEMRDVLHASAPHPHVLDLTYYPKTGTDPTPEQVVDEALCYKPIILK
jgi:hypothetical protein